MRVTGPVFSIARTAVADGAPASGASLEVRAGDVAVARFDANDTMAVSSRLLVKGRDVLGVSSGMRARPALDIARYCTRCCSAGAGGLQERLDLC